MRKYVFLITLIFISLITLAFTFPTENTFPLFGKFIILDPGHGAEDPGSVYKDIYEKDYNLSFAQSLKTTLEKYGATVLLTRNGDYDLSSPNATKRKRSDFDNRIIFIDENKADLYLSLHMNYLNSTKYYGSQVFYSDVNSQNEILANTLTKELNSFFKFDKSYKKIGNDKYMFNKINTTGVLIEYGFLSSSLDREKLNSEEYRNELSEVITKGLIEYFT